MAVLANDLVLVERSGVLHKTTAGEVGALGGGGGGLPIGGTAGQVLTKASAVDGDATWQSPMGGAYNPVLGWAF